jgi:hypothetical protein
LYHRLAINDEQQAWLENELEITIRNEWLPKVTRKISKHPKGISSLGLSVEEVECEECEEFEFDGLEQGLFPDSGPRIEDGIYVDEDEISFDPTERQLRSFGYRRDEHGFKYRHEGD